MVAPISMERDTVIAARDVPVVLFLFNRPDLLARVVGVLSRVRPRLILAVADGPRPDHPEDAERCDAARAIIDQLDWPCQIVREFSETNLGCGARIASGLNWAFQEVSEAIVLEDDVLPDPTFFAWCARMLDRYRHEPRVMHVSGRNHLGRWTQTGGGHCLLHRANVWGWATWRRAWQHEVPMPGTPDDIARVAKGSGIDPLVVDNFLMLQELATVRNIQSWDTAWELRKALAGGLSVVPSVNLVANIGFGPEATHNKFAGDIGALTPVGPAPSGAEADRCVGDRRLDRWSMLFELMATYRVPDLVWRLAHSARLAMAGPWSVDRRLSHHLAPFRNPHESLAVLEHFCAVGVAPEPLNDLFSALRRAAANMPLAPAASTLSHSPTV
jgi:hypothetical protein